MTYSIVAYDPATGELGVGTVTAWPMVGAGVPWVEPGFGAVATQSFTNPDLGSLALTHLRDGASARQTLDAVIAFDAGRDVRQVGIVDAQGRAAGYTGRRCVAEAGHEVGSGAIALGNMLEQDGTPEAMLAAYRDATGDLAERMLLALRQGEARGGDIRGRRSAALLVAPGTGPAQAWSRRFDLRVDSTDEPLDALARLLRTARAYEALKSALAAATPVELATAAAALQAVAPEPSDDPVLGFWLAVVLFATGERAAAEPILAAALRVEPRLREYAYRYREAGHRELLGDALAWVARDGRR